MEHAWLDSLSEDWVSQHGSDGSPAAALPSLKSTENSRAPSLNGSGSRIPLPIDKPKQHRSESNDNSISALSERSANEINIHASYRGPSKLSQEVKFSERGRNTSRSVSASTNGSVVHNTVQHKAPSASPPKGKGHTPEWKRRLVYGDVAYGEQRDLFHSAATGLENMFKPPAPPQDESTEEESVQISTAFPSSPPLYHAREVSTDEDDEDDDNEGSDEDQMDGSPSPSPRRQQRDVKYRMTEDSIEPSRLSDFSIHQDSHCRDTSAKQSVQTVATTVSVLASHTDASRKVSGQSDVRNEDFSPILLGRQKANDGQVDFAPIEIPMEQLKQRLEKLRINQMLVDSHFGGNLSFDGSDKEDASYGLENTEDYARNGGFLNLKRGGRSAEGSFRHRMLSPGLGTDTSEMLPEESLQASTPKQYPTIRIDEIGYGSKRLGSQSPPAPRAPYPSPEKRNAKGQGNGGSPLKLFGPYDTFTNQTLLRRISQFEDQMSRSSRHSPGLHMPDDHSHSDVNHAFMTTSSPQKHVQDLPSMIASSRSVSQFGAGDLEGYEFNQDIALRPDEESYYDDDAENVDPQRSLFASENSLSFNRPHDSSPRDDDHLFVRRKRQKSVTTMSSSRSVSMTSQQSLRREYNQALRPGPEVLATPKKRDSGSEGKRPRTSPSKDPTPKRRRTLHKSDIAYGRDDQPGPLDSVHNSHQHMQSMMGKKRKDARPGDLQQAANPNILAVRQMLRPRTPTPSQRSSLQREQHPFADDGMPEEQPQRRSPNRASQFASSFAENSVPGETDRKPSIRTQDFLDEAGKIMAMIRGQAKPPSGLASVEESETENGEPSPNMLEESFQESTREPFSRPPSREGKPVARVPARQEDPEILNHLRKYQELSDMGDVISSSIRSMTEAKDALRAAQEIERQLRSSPRSRLPLTDSEDFDGNAIISDPPNIRISENPLRQRESTRDGMDFPSNSSGSSTNRSIPTGSSRGSDSRKTIAPQSVSHLIPDQVGSMYLDRHQNIWIKRKGSGVQPRAHNVLPSEDSEDDPFGSIPDLSVDMTKELQHLRIIAAQKEAEAQDALDALEKLSGQDPASPSRTPRGHLGKGYVTLSPNAAITGDFALQARDELTKLESKAGTSPAREDSEDVEHEISLHEDRVASSTSRRRNLTISFSSPIASIIQDLGAEDINNLSDDPQAMSDWAKHGDVEQSNMSRYQSLTKAARKKLVQPRARSTSRGVPRHLAAQGEAFMPRPVSRIDEQDEESMAERAHAESRQVSIVGDHSVVSHGGPENRQTSLSFVVTTPGRTAFAALHPDASAIIGQNVGNMSLSPLSEFTMNNAEQSFGLEVSYIVEERHLITGDGSKRVMSMTVRDLVGKLSEVEPFEPYWEDFVDLDLSDKRLSSLHMLDEFCGRLVALDVSNNSIGHLDGVPTSVRQLKVTQNLLSELTSWDHLANLQYVDVSDNELHSLSALKNLVHLRSVRADNNQLTSLDGLNLHDGLLTLRVRDNLIEEVDFEGTKLHRLTELDLGGNRITAIRNVGQLSSLETLKLQGNCLESFSVEASERLQSLRYLDLSDNSLLSLDVSRLPSLRLLHADRNCISKITGFTRARHLDSLSLREQRGSGRLDLSFLSAAYEIRKLFLSGNYIGKFEPRVDFLNLQLLELANCGLQSLPENLGQLMPNVRSLNLNFNAIADLSPIRYIPRLKKLFVAGNRLADSTSVTEILTEFPHLSQLDLRDNPVTQGFYPPVQVMVPVDRSAYVDPFTLPEAEKERDDLFASRLDEATKLRRRLYQIVFVGCCQRLKMLDGLYVKRQLMLARDGALKTLVSEGLLPGDVGIEPPLTVQNGEEDGDKENSFA